MLPGLPSWSLPRTGGDQSLTDFPGSYAGQSSPHGRGSVYHDNVSIVTDLVFPARAGISRYPPGFALASGGLPRTGGDQSGGATDPAARNSSSPHGRGSVVELPVAPFDEPVFPARAGISRLCPMCGRPAAGLPRTGGDQSVRRRGAVAPEPSSPHGRGSVAELDGPGDGRHVFPARAGISRAGCCR